MINSEFRFRFKSKLMAYKQEQGTFEKIQNFFIAFFNLSHKRANEKLYLLSEFWLKWFYFAENLILYCRIIFIYIEDVCRLQRKMHY